MKHLWIAGAFDLWGRWFLLAMAPGYANSENFNELFFSQKVLHYAVLKSVLMANEKVYGHEIWIVDRSGN